MLWSGLRFSGRVVPLVDTLRRVPPTTTRSAIAERYPTKMRTSKSISTKAERVRECAAVRKLVTDKPIAFHRCYVDICEGSVAGAVFLAQLLYWSDKGEDDNGWFWKTHKQWTKETGLTRDQQVTVRAALVKTGILSERLSGVPAKLFFKVDYNKLTEYLASSPVEENDSPDVAIPTSDVAIPTPRCSYDHTIKDSESTSENTTENTHSEMNEISPTRSEPYFPAFRSRWRSATGVGCPKGKGEVAFVELYTSACARYAEEDVLSMVDEYGLENAEWIKKYRATPRKFFEELDEIAEARRLTAQRIENAKLSDPWEKLNVNNREPRR